MEYNEDISLEKITEMLAARLKRLFAEQEGLNVLHERMDQEKDAISGRVSAIESKLLELEKLELAPEVEALVQGTPDEKVNDRQVGPVQEMTDVLQEHMDQEIDAISGRMSAIESKLAELEKLAPEAQVEEFVKRTLDEKMNNRFDPVQERVDLLVERWNVYQRDAVTGQGLSAIESKLSVLEEFFLELTAILEGRPS